MTVRIRRKLDSETLYLPELRPLIGKTVEIIVQEEPLAAITPGTGDWDAVIKAVEELEDYDFVQRQRETDLKHARDHLPRSWWMLLKTIASDRRKRCLGNNRTFPSKGVTLAVVQDASV